jgi:hypothetical protein
MEFSIDISGSLGDRLQELAGEREGSLRRAIRSGLEQGGRDLVAMVVLGMRASRTWKTGFLASTIRSRMMDDSTVKIGSAYDAEMKKPVVYAAQVHFGGPISPRRGKYLAWPVSPEFGGIIPTRSGVGGINASDAEAATDFRVLGATGSFVRPSRSGRTKILFYRFGDRSYKPAFVLSKGVEQDGKPYLIPVVEENTDVVVSAIEEAIRKAGIA